MHGLGPLGMTNAESFGYRDVVLALRDSGIEPDSKVLAIGPAAIPENLRGGVSALLSALLSSCQTVLTPTFTFQTMVYPSVGPEDNAVDYPAASAASTDADIFRIDMPASPSIGPFAEALRTTDGSARSIHPILSFAGVRADDILETQTLDDPFAPVDALARSGGDVLLLGADHQSNIALHLAEVRAGRWQFIRWALTPGGAVECPSFPGCSRGFDAIETKLQGTEQTIEIGSFRIARIPLRDLLHIATGWIRADPRALLCSRSECAFCNTIRKKSHKRAG
jgi:aminoglycoside 3-N-acetyltransferase